MRSQTWFWEPVNPAHYDHHGDGCPGTLGTPVLSLTSPWTLPRIGDNLQVTLTGLPTHVAGLVMGFSDQVFGGAALPNHLDWLGMPGCYLRAAPEASTFLVGQNHAASLSLTIPNAAGLLGLDFYQQGLPFDAAANTLGITVTNSMRGTIGSW
ncbi:MAG: hypothetical protein KDC98_21945 [Planctomycetes bacterium]|nr:hypothetical protein [Planctomycetota bacterium]